MLPSAESQEQGRQQNTCAMNPTAIPHLAGLLDELLLNPTPTRLHPFALLANPADELTADLENDFLVQNRRPDLVSFRTPDQALRALDLP